MKLPQQLRFFHTFWKSFTPNQSLNLLEKSSSFKEACRFLIKITFNFVSVLLKLILRGAFLVYCLPHRLTGLLRTNVRMKKWWRYDEKYCKGYYRKTMKNVTRDIMGGTMENFVRDIIGKRWRTLRNITRKKDEELKRDIMRKKMKSLKGILGERKDEEL